MLFRDDKYNSPKYSFENEPTEVFTYTDLCNTLSHLTEILCQDLNLHQEVWLQETLIDGRSVRCKFISEGLKNATLDRGYNEIHNILCRKPEFKRRLEKIGIKEPKDRNTLEFSVYLQFLYFFYILIYFVFPNIKFLDLFEPKNWSTENTIECDTGNEIYEDFIIKNLKQNSRVKEMFETKVQSYDDAWSLCCDMFFRYYELNYYTFINEPGEEAFQDSCTKENSEAYTQVVSKKLKELHKRIEKEILPEATRNLYQDFLDFDINYTSTTLNQDAKLNYEAIDFESLIQISEELIEYDLNAMDENLLKEEDLIWLCEQDEFICLCMGVDHITNTIRNKYKTYEIYAAIKKIWDFEKYQMMYYPVGEGFTFLQKEEDEYYMSLADCLVIAKTRIHLPVKFSYYSKRTYLDDRSDGQKKVKHSLKQSFKSVETENFDVKKSVFRDDIFRIACRMQMSILKTNSPREFLYFELPMNTQLFELCEYAESYPQIEQKQQYYELAYMYMKEEISALYKSEE